MSDDAKWPKGPKPWSKLWHNILDCAKLHRVTEALRWRYVALLSVACRFDMEGKLPDVDRIAFAIRLDLGETQATLDQLVAAGLIDKRAKSYWMHNWDHWQSGKSKSAERQKRYRDRRNALRNALRNGPVTGDVTPTSRVASSRTREEEEKESEEDQDKDVRTSGDVPRAQDAHTHANGPPKSKAQELLERRRRESKSSDSTDPAILRIKAEDERIRRHNEGAS